MFKGKLKVMLCAFIVGVLLSISVAAYAATSSWYNIPPIYGHSYRNQATANLVYGGVQAITYIECTDGNVPAGYMGAQAQMFNSNDTLYSISSWVYTTSIAKGLYQTLPAGGVQGAYYYSCGYTTVWNGNGYTGQPTYRTPNVLYQ